MARGVNKVILIGNLGADPDMRSMPSGDAIANFSLATSDTWNDKQTGEKRERTEWHRICAFGRLAEVIGQYCRKGSKLYIEGRLQTRKWTDNQGIERYTTEIIANDMQMLDSRMNDGNSWQQSQGGNYYAAAEPQHSAPIQPQRQQQPPAPPTTGYTANHTANTAPNNGNYGAQKNYGPQGNDIDEPFDDDSIPF